MRQHVLVSDEGRRIFPNRPAGDVIAMVVAVEHIADGNVESHLDLGSKLYREIPVRRVDQDDAFVGDEEHRVVTYVADEIEVFCYLLEMGNALRRYARREYRRSKEHEGRKTSASSIHCSTHRKALYEK